MYLFSPLSFTSLVGFTPRFNQTCILQFAFRISIKLDIFAKSGVMIAELNIVKYKCHNCIIEYDNSTLMVITKQVHNAHFNSVCF